MSKRLHSRHGLYIGQSAGPVRADGGNRARVRVETYGPQQFDWDDWIATLGRITRACGCDLVPRPDGPTDEDEDEYNDEDNR